ncbi:tetratricopeptide repeat protein [Nostoc sp.]
MLKFVGREAELQNLHQMLQENNQVVIAAIAGMGGLGKTELALQYAMAHCETYKGGICWLLAKAGDVGIQIVQFARTQLDLNPPENFDLLAQVQYCFRLWREGDVLLVLDDVGEYQQVKPYLPPPSSRFKVLITTRQHLGASIKELSLDVLQPEAALELLKSFFKETPQRIEQELTVANQLCEWLGYLPLGLELVGRYLARKQDLSVTEMLRRLEKKRLEQLAFVKPEADMTAQRGVLAAFELSWQELEDSDKQLGCLLSIFAPAPIPWKLVEQCLPEEDEEELEEIRDDKLLNLHLLQRKAEGIYQLHPLLREFFQYKLTGLEQAEELKRSLCRVMVAIAKSISHPQSITHNTITAVNPALQHLEEAAKALKDLSNDDDLIWLFTGLGRFYEGQGFYEQAETWYKLCIEVADRPSSFAALYKASSRNNLASLYTFQGYYSQAEDQYKEALEINRHLLGEEHPATITTLSNLAYLYKAQKFYEKAKPIYKRALELRICLLGETHIDVATSLNNLAALYSEEGNYWDAELLCTRSIEICQINEDFLKLTFSLNTLANIYCGQHRYSEAEQQYQQVVVWRKTLLGEDHHQVAISLDQLAYLYRIQHRYKEAEILCVKALEIFEQRLGVNNPDTVMCRENLEYIRDRLPPNPE